MLDGNLDAIEIEGADDVLRGLFNVREIVGRALTAMQQYTYLSDSKLERLSDADWIDLGILWRDLEKAFDKARKESLKRKETCQTLFGTSRARLIAKDPTNSDKAVGRLGSGRADVKTLPILPRRGTPEHTKMLSVLGVEQWAIDEKLLSLNWSHVSDYLSACTIEGKEAPFEMKTENTMTATFTKKRTPK